MDQNVGGLYTTTADRDDEEGEAEISSGAELEYCSLSDRMVMPDSASG